MIDTHYHLDQLDDEQLDRMLREAQAGGVQTVIAPATGLESARRLLQIRDRYPQLVKIGVGVHPERPDVCSGDAAARASVMKEIGQLEQLLQMGGGNICAIGEVGLPYYSLPEGRRLPEMIPGLAWDILERSLTLAKNCRLPVILHAVHTMARPCMQLILRHGIERAVFHWLKAPHDVVDEIVSHGFYISVTPEAVYRERDMELLRRVPLGQLLLETDGPWPHRGPYQGRLTHPLWVGDVAQTAAWIHGVSVERVLVVTADNARELFRLEGE
ncbi:TatD family hydrolase [Effusibacillus pohliae]|uniref:TatD family hydrolase n=1 Tax=Effusibacillus pohliae TaxID=232270 RepID=UPI00036827AD|nr:TatD family hydrolase [Effusibacillus pohliae]